MLTNFVARSYTFIGNRFRLTQAKVNDWDQKVCESTSPMEKMDWPTHLLNILHLERSYLIQKDFQAELGLDFGWAMVSWFVSGMMFGHATLLRDACHNLYQFTRFSWSQSDRLHSIWRRKKDLSLYSTTHPRAFGFRILSFFFFYREDNIFW